MTYANCPKCGGESGGLKVCPKCGLIFAKYGQRPIARQAVVEADEEPGRLARFKAALTYVPEEVDPISVYARAALLALIAVYGVYLSLMDIPSAEIWGSLMHYPIVPIHEFGHIVFMPFGEFMYNLGGTLFSVLLPLIFGGILLAKNRDPFGASVMLWWAAVVVIDAAPYVYDAYKPQHILLTGRTGDEGGHDFVDVLGDLGLLNKAQPIGYGVRIFGAGMMALALAWGAYVLWLQYRSRNDAAG